MDNMGGLRKLWYVGAEYFVSLIKGIDNLYTLELDNEAEIVEIEFSDENGKISHNEQTSDNGSVYSFEVSVRIPNCNEDNNEGIGEMKSKRLLIIAEDNNERLWLAGAPGSYFNISLQKDTGSNNADLNHQVLKISAEQMSSCVFINSLS